MVMRGDTLVYNADALNLAAGSMLERLIEQLPGVQLDDAGQITVNGSRVDKLLLNGKDFFRGDPLVALENLPAYMVDEVKVYQQEAPDAYLRPGRDEDEPQSSGGWEDGSYVMDVWLKREYAAGWIGNAEGAYGTDRRYQARALALRFSDRSRTSLYFNLNNTNDTRRPGRSGNWTSAWTASGLTAMKEGGIDFLLTDPTPRRRGELSTTLTARYEDADSRSETSGTQFLTSGDVFSRSRTADRTKKTSVNWDNKFELRAKRFYASLTPSVQFVRQNSAGTTQAADFRREPVETYPPRTRGDLSRASARQPLCPGREPGARQHRHQPPRGRLSRTARGMDGHRERAHQFSGIICFRTEIHRCLGRLPQE